MSTQYRCLLVEKLENKQFSRSVTHRSIDNLPAGDLLIKVDYSSLNYKDALSAMGNPAVSRNFPHTPGIDAAGNIVESNSDDFAVGDKVLVTGFDLGMNTAGGFGEYIRIPKSWAVKLPENLTTREAMIIGTAGFTAAMSVQALLDGGTRPEHGQILVTGSTGGVGSVAIALLAKSGFEVVAVTGKAEQAEFLKSLGASEVVTRESLLEGAEKPMMRERWAGVVDCVGGNYLAAAIKSTRYGGNVTCCGLTASADLSLNVFPFILRGVSLLGIDSVECPMAPRLKLWAKLASEWKLDNLEDFVTECSLDALDQKINDILAGKVVGRTLVNLKTD
ncbi:YhdH/YhfP family quinone oxidoreductase [Sessilibacter sp. MAH4]